MKIIKAFIHFLKIKKTAQEISRELTLDETERFAKSLLENPLYLKIIESFKKEAIYLWEKALTLEERERIWSRLRTINEVDLRIKMTIEMVKYEKALLEK